MFLDITLEVGENPELFTRFTIIFIDAEQFDTNYPFLYLTPWELLKWNKIIVVVYYQQLP